MKRKTPQEKKQLDYSEQIRPDIEAPHAFRKNWPKKKARENRRTRQLADEVVRKAVAEGDLESVTAGAVKFVRKGAAILKTGVRNLKDRVQINQKSRVAAEHRSKTKK